MTSGKFAAFFAGPATICFGLIASIVLACPIAAAAEKQPFTIDDYFKVQRVTELSLSSSGEMIAYTVERQSLRKNRSVRTVYVSATTPSAEPILIDKIQNARSLAWIPGTHELAFLLNDGEVSQLYSIDAKNNKIRQHTSGDEPVVKFRFAPDGGALAWLTQTDSDDKPLPLFERLFNGEEGVVLDSENAVVYQFVNPDWPDLSARPTHTLWVKQADAKAFHVEVPGQVRSFYWSSDAPRLSISYTADNTSKKSFFANYTSIGIFDVATKTFRELVRAHPPSETKQAQYYTGGEWVPGEDKVFVRRTTERDAWMSSTEWSLFNLSTDKVLENENINWQETEIYARDGEPAFLPATENSVYSNKTVHARQFLYKITKSGLKSADILQDVQGSVSFVRFSSDFRKAAFVNESLTRPPEIYIWRRVGGVKKLTRLNKEIDVKRLPTAREVTWKSEDGATVQGWLLEPVGGKSDNKPWPLVTFVHGGPALAMPDEFAFYYKANGGIWPYPLEVYAVNGMAVFIPNYRGTKTFGDEFAHPAVIDGEPVDDIVSGIEHLIGEGIGDPDRLAISGHSHGAWLASLVMTRAKLFRVGSFAEGTPNQIANYSLMPDWLNRNVHDINWGVSLYDDPQRYIDVSPELHFKGLDAAVLFEAGSKSLAINMMGSPKAARRAGMPVEFVVYPKTGHNIRLPRLKKESAERNIDWLRFWLLSEEDPTPAKAMQYERWRKLRTLQDRNKYVVKKEY